MLPMVNIHVRFLILSFPKTHWQKSIKLYSRVFKSQLIYLAHEFIVLAEDLKIFSSFPVCTAVVQPKNDLLQSNQYKTTTLGNTQKWCPGQVIVLWNTFINDHKPNLIVLGRFLVSLCEYFINKKIDWNKDLQFWCPSWRLKMFLVTLILNLTVLRKGVMQMVFIMCKSCEISNQMFFNIMFSFSRTNDGLVMTDILKIKLFSGAVSHGASKELQSNLESN